MKTELEVKILDIDPVSIQQKLIELGATFVGEALQKRYVYDFYPVDPGKWIRLRQKNNTVELTIKEIENDSITGTKELEIQVSDFETTHAMLQKLGYHTKAYQENKRISYCLNNVQIELDFWPMIPPYLEIEAESQEEIYHVVQLLGLSKEGTTSINTTKVYTHYGIDLASITDLRL